MSESSKIDPVVVSFSATWFSRRLGVDYSEETWTDPVARTERAMETERALYDCFGDVGIGSQDPRPFPTIEAYGNYFSPALFGCEIKYSPDQAPANLPLGDSIEDMRRLDVPDLERNAVIRRAMDDADALRRRYGFCHGGINMGSPLNVAVNVYGEEFMVACLIEPETAQHVLRVIGETQFRLYREVCSVIDPANFPPVERITLGYGNCPAIMFSPDLYRKVILPVDKWFRSRVDSLPLHHCGVFDDYIDLYRELDPTALDIGGGSDYRAIRRAFPETPFSLIVNPPDVEGRTQTEIDGLIGAMVDGAAPYDRISFLWVAELGQAVSDETVRALRTAHERV